MILRTIKKFLYNKELDKKIKYIEKFITGRCSHKVIDPVLDEKEKDIEKRLKEKLTNNKISYEKYASVMNGIYYHRNINKNFEIELAKYYAEGLRSPNDEETKKYLDPEIILMMVQHTNCETTERSDENVR